MSTSEAINASIAEAQRLLAERLETEQATRRDITAAEERQLLRRELENVQAQILRVDARIRINHLKRGNIDADLSGPHGIGAVEPSGAYSSSASQSLSLSAPQSLSLCLSVSLSASQPSLSATASLAHSLCFLTPSQPLLVRCLSSSSSVRVSWFSACVRERRKGPSRLPAGPVTDISKAVCGGEFEWIVTGMSWLVNALKQASQNYLQSNLFEVGGEAAVYCG